LKCPQEHNISLPSVGIDTINSFMPKSTAVVPIPPKGLKCPFCGAGRGKACKTRGGSKLRNALGIRVTLIHVARVAKAARMDAELP